MDNYQVFHHHTLFLILSCKLKSSGALQGWHIRKHQISQHELEQNTMNIGALSSELPVTAIRNGNRSNG